MGRLESIVVPSPSSPRLLRPNAHISPLSVISRMQITGAGSGYMFHYLHRYRTICCSVSQLAELVAPPRPEHMILFNGHSMRVTCRYRKNVVHYFLKKGSFLSFTQSQYTIAGHPQLMIFIYGINDVVADNHRFDIAIQPAGS